MITGLPTPSLVPSLVGIGSSFIVAESALTQTATGVTITPANGSPVSIPAATDSFAGMLDAARATTIDGLKTVASSGLYTDLTATPDRTAFLSVVFDGGGSAIVAPIVRYLYVPFDATITGWVLLADRSGSITIDVWKEAVAGYPPTVANSIVGGVPMALASQLNNSAFPPSPSWSTVKILAGDIIALNVSAATTVQTVTAQLVVTH